MGVRSSDLQNGEPIGTFSRAALRRRRGSIEKFAAWGVLGMGVLGTIATAHGGWANLLAAPSIGATVGALAIQAVLTWLQWSYDDLWYVAWPARAVDALLTALGYGFLFVGGLSTVLGVTGLATEAGAVLWWQVSVAGLTGWAVIYLVALLVAWYPEHTLVQ